MNKKEFMTLNEELYYLQLQEAISLLRDIYNDRICNQEMKNIEEFLENFE